MVSLLQIGGTIVGDQDFSLRIFPDQNLERQIDGNAGRRQHHGSAALCVPENQQFGRMHFHVHLCRLAAVIDQREKRDAFGLQNSLQLLDCFVHRVITRDIDQSVAAGMDGTLNLDAQPTTRAIRARADTPEEIEQMFDGISYGKASDVLLSVENYVGPETFRQGVHSYLSAHLYGNATAEDFWNAQTATSHKPVDKVMEGLIGQAGVPLLTFGQPSSGKVSVSQRRFFLTPSIEPDPSQKWTLPVCFKTAGSKQDCQHLTPSRQAETISVTQRLFS